MSVRKLPGPVWLKTYRREYLAGDAVAGFIVAVTVIPQSLAYAQLAGLPPQFGLYASILPMAVYALFGTSPTLSVGPVVIVSLMSGDAIRKVAEQGSPEFYQAAMALAVLSGVMLFVMGLLRMGFLSNFLSQPVISGVRCCNCSVTGKASVGHRFQR